MSTVSTGANGDNGYEEPMRGKQDMKANLNILLYATSLLVCAGMVPTASAAETAADSQEPERPLYRPLTLGVEAGTTGLGGYFSWRFSDLLGARVGADYFSYSDTITVEHTRYTATGRLLSEPLTLDIYPWKKHSFHISAGVMFNQNRLTGDALVAGAGGFGLVTMKIEQQPVNPYLSIGGNFFYFDHAHHWAMGGELGVAYTGDQKVSVSEAAGFSAAGRREQANLEHYANKYQWWPVLKLGVSYSV
jgi:hypothetical protein